MKKAKIILKFFDELDNEIERDCITIREFIKKIDKEIEQDWINFKKFASVTFRVIDEKDNTILKEHCTSKDFKKESIIIKNKMN